MEASLRAIVGETQLCAGEAWPELAVEGRVPRWVAVPGSVTEVAACLALASAQGLAVAPIGQGTRRHWGDVPTALDLVVCLRRLDRVLRHEPADLTMSVEAGITLGALNRVVAPCRQFLPLDPARAASSTIGGLVATGASGPYRARYGTIRDSLLGVTVVLADGTVVKAGGRVVKNATGYDMTKLHVGAIGTLGIVVETHLRVHARPAEEATWVFGFPVIEAAGEAGLAVMAEPIVPSRLQLLNDAAGRQIAPPGLGSAALAVTVGSVPAAVKEQGERIAGVCRRLGGVPVPVGDPEAWWGRVSDAGWPSDASRRAWSTEPVAVLTLRVGVRVGDVVKAYRAIEAVAPGDLSALVSAEVLNGVLHVALSGPALAGGTRILPDLREALAALDGSCVVEHAPVDLKPGIDVWGDVGPAIALMRRLKAEFDPRGTLNPGRFVQGI